MRKRVNVFLSCLCKTSAIAIPIVVLGCAPPLSLPFDENQARYATQRGENEISGTAKIVSKGGYTRTCEYGGVYLLPATNYWNAWVGQVFGSTRATYAPRIKIEQLAVDDRAWTLARHADCDSGGHFRFSQVSDGKYYVFAEISWLLRWQHNGGGLLQTVDVRNGVSTTVALRQDWRMDTDQHSANVGGKTTIAMN